MYNHRNDEANEAMQYQFEQWMKDVDNACGRIAGVSIHDLADCNFRDWYMDEMPAREAAQTALKAEGFYSYYH